MATLACRRGVCPRPPIPGRTICAPCAAKIRALDQFAYARVKQAAIDALGGSCAACGISDIRVLTIHHPDEDGAAHRAQLGGYIAKNRDSRGFYKAVIRGEAERVNLQVLCSNCHLIANWTWNPTDPAQLAARKPARKETKLGWTVSNKLRADRLAGMTYVQLATKYQVNEQTVWRILAGKSYGRESLTSGVA